MIFPLQKSPFSILMAAPPEFVKEFLLHCEKDGSVEQILSLEPQLQTLSVEGKELFFGLGFMKACVSPNLEVAKHLISTPLYQLDKQPKRLYDGLKASVSKGQLDILKYAWEQSSLQLKQKCSTDPYRILNIALFKLVLCNAKNLTALQYIADFIEDNTMDAQGRKINLFTMDHSSAFKMAWLNSQELSLSFLINRYRLTGTEPVVEAFLSEATSAPSAQQLRDHVRRFILINQERPLLEGQVAQRDIVSGDSTPHKLSQNKYKL